MKGRGEGNPGLDSHAAFLSYPSVTVTATATGTRIKQDDGLARGNRGPRGRPPNLPLHRPRRPAGGEVHRAGGPERAGGGAGRAAGPIYHAFSASKPGIALWLIANRGHADVDALSEISTTALHSDSEEGPLSVVLVLVEAGANSLTLSRWNDAAEGGHANIIAYLMTLPGVKAIMDKTTSLPRQPSPRPRRTATPSWCSSSSKPARTWCVRENSESKQNNKQKTIHG